MAGEHSATSPSTSGLSSGPSGRHRALPRHSEASVWLGARRRRAGPRCRADHWGGGRSGRHRQRVKRFAVQPTDRRPPSRTVVRATTIRSEHHRHRSKAPMTPLSVGPPRPLSATTDNADDSANGPGLTIKQLVLENGGIPEAWHRTRGSVSSAVSRAACSRRSPAPSPAAFSDGDVGTGSYDCAQSAVADEFVQCANVLAGLRFSAIIRSSDHARVLHLQQRRFICV